MVGAKSTNFLKVIPGIGWYVVKLNASQIFSKFSLKTFSLIGKFLIGYKTNTKNRREKIQGGILAKGVIDDCMCTKRVCAPRENTENEGSEFLLTKYRFI